MASQTLAHRTWEVRVLKTYEGMFVFDPAVASDWDSIQTELNRLMERAGARMIVSGKWDDRRLAYEIKGRRRGIYVLTYFEADPTKIVSLERDAQLSEAILRILVVRAEHLTEDEMKEAVASGVVGADEGPSGGAPSRRPDRDERAGKGAQAQQAEAAKEADAKGGEGDADKVEVAEPTDVGAPED